MAIDPKFFLHESDQAALDALEAIPGFTALIKGFMNGWNENQFRILNMSSRLRISETQLPKYYNMLVPICEKLGIEVPELYLEMNVHPNAYTYGDTKPFIVLTSGLLDTLPEELIPTVIAHECGHIACHHTLYRTMGQIILTGAAFIPGLGLLATVSLKAAFAYWMRCSEFSADRAAILCEGTSEHVVEMCMRFAGYSRHIEDTASRKEFLSQAVEYKKLVQENMLNQTMEFMMLAGQSHPLTAVRAYEADAWGTPETIGSIMTYMQEEEEGRPHTVIPMSSSAASFAGKDIELAEETFRRLGFRNIKRQRVSEHPTAKPGQVTGVTVGNAEDFAAMTWFRAEDPVVLSCYEPLTVEEQKALHPGEVMMPDSVRHYIGRHYSEVGKELAAAGFTNIFVARTDAVRPLFAREGTVTRITIDDSAFFEQGDWFKPSAHIRITCYQ